VEHLQVPKTLYLRMQQLCLFAQVLRMLMWMCDLQVQWMHGLQVLQNLYQQMRDLQEFYFLHLSL
jgi:hypothetical protein